MILSFFKHNPRDPTRRVICPSLHAKNRDTANRFGCGHRRRPIRGHRLHFRNDHRSSPPSSLPGMADRSAKRRPRSFYPVNEVPRATRHGDRRWAIIVARTTDRSIDRSLVSVSPPLLRGPRSPDRLAGRQLYSLVS